MTQGSKRRPRRTAPADPDVDRGEALLAELLRWVEQARTAEARGALRKQHLVPASYLRRWEHSGLIRVFDVQARRSYRASPATAARETDFYRLASADPELDPASPPPVLFEVMLSKIEAAAVPAFEAAIVKGQAGLGADLALNLATFVAFQLVRGRQFRARLDAMVSQTYTEMYRGVPGTPHASHAEASDELGARPLLAAGLRSGDLEVRTSQARAVALIGEAAEVVLPWLSLCHWHVVHALGELVTCDEPVLLLGGPRVSRAQGAGMANARLVTMPLDPHHLLVLARTPEPADNRFLHPLTPEETEEINLELLANASRWQFASPNRGPLLPVLPPAVPDLIVERNIEIVGESGDRLMRYFTPSRWLYVPHAPWPVARWWDECDSSPAAPVWWPPRARAVVNGYRDAPSRA